MSRRIYITPREAQILGLMKHGNTYPDVATALHISLYTVKTHVLNAKLRLNASNIKEALTIAITQNLI